MDVQVNKSDVIWSYLGIIFSFVVSVITLPIVVYFLDGDMLGLWYVFLSIGSITLLFDFGFTVTFARNITYCWSGASRLEKKGLSEGELKEPDYYLMRNILYTCKRIYFVIAFSALFLMLTIGTAYIIYISSSISGFSHIVAWIIYALAAFLNLYYNYYDSFLRGVGAIKRANQNRVYARSFQLILLLLLLIVGYGIIGLSIAYLSFGIVFRFLGRRYFYSYQGIGDRLLNIKDPININEIKNLFKTIWYNAWRDGIVSLSLYLSGQASVILCSLYLTLTETGAYSIGVQIASVVCTLSATLFGTYQPAIQSNWVKHNVGEVRRIMCLIVIVYTLSFVIGGCLVVVIGLPILRLIRPEVVISISLMLGILASQFILQFRNCYTSYFSCTNRLDYMPSFILSSVLCIILSLIFLELFKLQAWGLILGQIISQCIFNVWYWPLKAHKELDLSSENILFVIRQILLDIKARNYNTNIQ